MLTRSNTICQSLCSFEQEVNSGFHSSPGFSEHSDREHKRFHSDSCFCRACAFASTFCGMISSSATSCFVVQFIHRTFNCRQGIRLFFGGQLYELCQVRTHITTETILKPPSVPPSPRVSAEEEPYVCTTAMHSAEPRSRLESTCRKISPLYSLRRLQCRNRQIS